MRRLLAILMMTLLAACSGNQAPLVATDVDIREPMPGVQMSAGYLALTNNTAEPIVITDVTSPQFASVEMHESTIEDGVARMYPLDDLTIMAGQTVRFQPGGKHLMLMHPAADANRVTLEFRAGKAIVLTVTTAFSDAGP